MYRNKDKNGREDFEELNSEVELKRWFEKLLRLAQKIWFL